MYIVLRKTRKKARYRARTYALSATERNKAQKWLNIATIIMCARLKLNDEEKRKKFKSAARESLRVIFHSCVIYV